MFLLGGRGARNQEERRWLILGGCRFEDVHEEKDGGRGRKKKEKDGAECERSVPRSSSEGLRMLLCHNSAGLVAPLSGQVLGTRFSFALCCAGPRYLEGGLLWLGVSFL